MFKFFIRCSLIYQVAVVTVNGLYYNITLINVAWFISSIATG